MTPPGDLKNYLQKYSCEQMGKCAICNIDLTLQDHLLFTELHYPYGDVMNQVVKKTLRLWAFCYAASSAENLKMYTSGPGFLNLYKFMRMNRNYLSKARPAIWVHVLRYLKVMI